MKCRILKLLPFKIKEFSFSGIIPQYPGKVIQINDPNFTSRYEIDWKIQLGDIIEKKSVTLLDLIALFYVYNKDYKVLHQDFEKLRSYIPIEVSPQKS